MYLLFLADARKDLIWKRVRISDSSEDWLQDGHFKSTDQDRIKSVELSLDKRKRWEMPGQIRRQIESNRPNTISDDISKPASKRKQKQSGKDKRAKAPQKQARTILVEKVGDWLSPNSNFTKRLVDSQDNTIKKSKNW